MKNQNKTQMLTVRFPSYLYDKICSEAEKHSTNHAEAIRVIVQKYFTDRDESARLDAVEATLLNALKVTEQNLVKQINDLVAS